MDHKLDLSLLPAVPPPPAGERIEPRARGLAGLIAGQESAILYHRSERLTAMVIVLNGRVVDAVAETPTEVVKGLDVLDELGDLAVAELQVISVAPRLARALPVYWRAPGATAEVVGGLLQPGRRGAVLASSPIHGTAVIVFDERGIVASFVDGEMREGAIDAVLADPATVIAPRADPPQGRQPVTLQPAPTEVAPPAPQPASAAGFELSPAAAAPYPLAPAPAGVFPGGLPPSGEPFGAWDAPGFGAGETIPAAASPYGAPPPDAALEQRRQAIVDLLQGELGRHADSVAAPFRTAPTLDALQGAAQALATESVRLISPTRMQNLSARATAIARGEQPPS